MAKSLVLIKPVAMHTGLGGTIIKRLEKKGLKVVAIKMVHMDKTLAERHYAVHKEKPFFEDLVGYITSAPVMAIVFEGEGVVQLIRETMGATDPTKAAKGTIRGDLGIDIRRNAVHGSDSAEPAEQEIKLFFTEDEIFG